MRIMLFQNNSEDRRMDKELVEVMEIQGSLRDETSITDPVIRSSNVQGSFNNVNYAYIEEFQRYYFVRDIRSICNGMWEFTMHVDVLMSFKESIRGNTAIIERNENDYNLKLNDGLFKTQQNPRIGQFPFPTGFDQMNFVLALAGNYGA